MRCVSAQGFERGFLDRPSGLEGTRSQNSGFDPKSCRFNKTTIKEIVGNIKSHFNKSKVLKATESSDLAIDLA